MMSETKKRYMKTAFELLAMRDRLKKISKENEDFPIYLLEDLEKARQALKKALRSPLFME